VAGDVIDGQCGVEIHFRESPGERLSENSMAIKLIAAVLVSVWSTSAPPERVSAPGVDKVRSQVTVPIAETNKRARIANGSERASPRERGCGTSTS
jgi:hypothetical protein